jgi:hypothetical protein
MIMEEEKAQRNMMKLQEYKREEKRREEKRREEILATVN